MDTMSTITAPMTPAAPGTLSVSMGAAVTEWREMTREQFLATIREGRATGYNRQLTVGVARSLPRGTRVLVGIGMVHEHVGGRPAEPHARVFARWGSGQGDIGIMDMDLGRYGKLPVVWRAETPAD